MLRTVAAVAILGSVAAAQPTVPSVDVAGVYRGQIKALDPANPRSVETAVKAIEAAASQNKTVLLPEIAAVLARPPDKKIVKAQVAAATAIGSLGAEAKASVTALLPAIDRPIPSVKTSTPDVILTHLSVAGAAVNAAAELHDPRATLATLRLMYRAPQLTSQVRRALSAYGPSVVGEIRKVLRGQHVEINQLFKAEKLDQSCIGGPCQPTSSREFYASIVAGDLGDPSLADDLLKVIKTPKLPAYVSGGEPGPSQHAAAFDALRKLGNPAVAPTLLAIIKDGKADLEDRTYAASVYAFVAADTKGVDVLGQLAADNTAQDDLRRAAAESFARLATTEADIKVMEALAKRYLDAAAKKRDETKKQKDATAIKATNQVADAYVGFARMFQNHMGRIQLGMLCKTDATCYSDNVWGIREDAVKRLSKYVPDVASWTDTQKQDLWEAVLDRGLIDMRKRGPVKPAVLDKLLDNAGTRDRVPRQAILLALTKVAPRPCPQCVTKLDAVIESDTGKPDLAELTIETTIVRNYLRWAK